MAALLVALDAKTLGQVENDRDRGAAVSHCQREERPARLRTDAGGVDHRELSRAQPLAGDRAHQAKCAARGRHVVLVVGYELTAAVRGDDLGRPKILRGKGRLASPRRPDENDKRSVRNSQLHSAESLPRGPASGLIRGSIRRAARARGSQPPSPVTSSPRTDPAFGRSGPSATKAGAARPRWPSWRGRRAVHR